MEIDMPLVIAVAALVLSALSPLVSSIVAGHYRIKETKLELEAAAKRRDQEFYQEHQAEVVEQYIKAAGRAIKLGARENFSEFGSAMGEPYLYVDSSLWPLLDSISDKITRTYYSDASDDLTKLCKALSSTQVRPKHGNEPDNPHGN